MQSTDLRVNILCAFSFFSLVVAVIVPYIGGVIL